MIELVGWLVVFLVMLTNFFNIQVVSECPGLGCVGLGSTGVISGCGLRLFTVRY